MASQDPKPFRLLSDPQPVSGLLPGATGPQMLDNGVRSQQPPGGATTVMQAWRPGINQGFARLNGQRNPYQPIPKKPLPMK